MYTIKEASSRTGVPVASLRAWERRYGVVEPLRTEGGYRLYDERAIAALSAMRLLVEDGWTPATAAAAITREGPESVVGRAARAANGTPGGSLLQRTGPQMRLAGVRLRDAAGAEAPSSSDVPEGSELTRAFLAAASAVDVAAIESALDRAFALGPFETVADGWLMPTMRALGTAWAQGHVDVAGEHAASYAVMRRLSHSFAAAASLTRGPRVVVGLPSGSHHELGALAFATAARRRGLAVVYVGADLPVASWRRAVRAFPTRVAVLAVVRDEDRPSAAETARALLESKPGIAVAAGGPFADDLAPGVVRLPDSIAGSAEVVENLKR